MQRGVPPPAAPRVRDRTSPPVEEPESSGVLRKFTTRKKSRGLLRMGTEVTEDSLILGLISQAGCELGRLLQHCLLLDRGYERCCRWSLQAMAACTPQNRPSNRIEFRRLALRDVFLHRAAHIGWHFE